jgi:hypothetical protein
LEENKIIDNELILKLEVASIHLKFGIISRAFDNENIPDILVSIGTKLVLG